MGGSPLTCISWAAFRPAITCQAAQLLTASWLIISYKYSASHTAFPEITAFQGRGVAEACAAFVAELKQLKLASPKLEHNEASLAAAVTNKHYPIAFFSNSILLFSSCEGQGNVLCGGGAIPVTDLLLASRDIS